MKTLTLLPLLLISTILHAKSYYISAAGNDNSSGLTPETAWQSIGKINSFSFSSNDSILFRRGDTFYGGITIKRSNLTFCAYGSGAKPVISGLSTVTGWVKIGTNLWEAPVSNVKPEVNLVLRDNAVQQVGRFPNADAPNAGYLTYTASTLNSITGSALSTTTNWTGAEVAIRINRWTIRRQKVLTHSGGTVSFATAKLLPRLGYGYFFQRDARTLDKDGEWWYDTTNKKLRVYSLANPSGYNYQISTVDILIGNDGYFNNITIKDLAFAGAGRKAVWMYSGSNQTITNVDVKFSGAEAISVMSSFNVDINNCTTSNSLASGIRVFNDNADPIKLSVTNCNVDSTALIAGMEVSDIIANGSNGICVRGNKNTIMFNRVTNSGYLGIEWQGNDVSIKYNVVSRFCSVRDDGGGIYTYEAAGANLPVRYNRRIVSNIILYAIGANAGAKQDNSTEANASARGLYFDEGTRTVTADSNTVAFCIGTAIHGNNNASLTITNNTFYGNKGGYSLQRLTDGAPIRSLLIKKNIIYPYYFEYRNLAINLPTLTTLKQDVSAIGILDSNYYCRKNTVVDASFRGITTYNDLSNYTDSVKSISYLKTSVGLETNSKIMKDSAKLFYNDTRSSKTITLDGNYADPNGVEYNGKITLRPFSSVLLYRLGDVIPPLTVTLGGDLLLTLPINSATLKGVITGSVTSYQWSKTSGPSQFLISSPTNQTTVISNLVAGEYRFKLLVRNSAGDSAFSTVAIVVAGVLPVKLTDFNATKSDGKVALEWQTSSEINVSHYVIERSGDGKTFEGIGQSISKNIASGQANYSFSDEFPLDGDNFYRLAMVDKDGSVEYSKIVKLNVQNSSAYTVQQLMVSSSGQELRLGVNSNYQQPMSVVVTDVSGRFVVQATLILQKGFNAFSRSIPGVGTGVYYISLKAKNQVVSKAMLATR